MAIYLTGDTHYTYDLGKLSNGLFDTKGLTRDDYVIILGDFGFVWTPRTEPGSPSWDEYQEQERWLDWFEAQPYTTLWIDGNHENFDLLEQIPSEGWYGGRVQRIREHVMHLMRGEIFEIDGRTFLALGGAHSTDRKYRVPHESWWPQEVPNNEERAATLTRLDTCDWQVDYVLTHAGPTRAMREIDPEPPYILIPDEYTQWLQAMADRLHFKRWFFGHYHDDRWWEKPFTCLYNEIFDLDDTGRCPYGSSTDLFDVY